MRQHPLVCVCYFSFRRSAENGIAARAAPSKPKDCGVFAMARIAQTRCAPKFLRNFNRLIFCEDGQAFLFGNRNRHPL